MVLIGVIVAAEGGGRFDAPAAREPRVHLAMIAWFVSGAIRGVSDSVRRLRRGACALGAADR
jgi:hypothetical protein